jgi:cyclopropane fatty-acyl-phospholipid synthase-like methyltransferase
MFMQPAKDPRINYKALVQQGYDHCASAYDAARQREANPELELVTSRLWNGARVLDIGCGAGMPIAGKLTQRFSVTGVDISGEQIRLARQQVPSGTFIQADIMTVDFSDAAFDAVVSFYAIFHVPREEHAELFTRIRRWLKPGGFLLATVAAQEEDPYTEDDFFGVTMFWSNYGLSHYCALLTALGFQLLATDSVTHGYTDAQERPAEIHPIIFARVI